MERERLAYIVWTAVVVAASVFVYEFIVGGSGSDEFGIAGGVIFFAAVPIWLLGVTVIFFASSVLGDRAASKWRRQREPRRGHLT
jgi:hypothetical protein